MRLEPDGLMGAIVGSESIGITETMVNGAGGCRSRAQIMLHDLIPEYETEESRCCESKYFSHQSRLPCTYINNNDVIFGTTTKVKKGISSISESTGRRTVLLDTLGASLICTDYSKIKEDGDHPIMMDGDLSSMRFCEGYDRCVRAILESYDVHNGGSSDNTVNLLGYGIQDLGWRAGEQELRMLLESIGVKVGCVLGCRPNGAEFQSVGNAALNVLVRPEYCTETASMMKDRFGIPSLRPRMGAPIGYEATRSFISEIAEKLEVDPTPALDIIDNDERAVHRIVMNYDKLSKALHAKGFVIDADSSTAYPLLRWLVEVFGMAPRKIITTDDEYDSEIRSYLESYGFEDSLGSLDGRVDVEFTDGITALEGRLGTNTSGHVEVRMPRGRMIDLIGRTLIGTSGCRYILDEMFNTMTTFRCGQPTNVEYRPCCH